MKSAQKENERLKKLNQVKITGTENPQRFNVEEIIPNSEGLNNQFKTKASMKGADGL